MITEEMKLVIAEYIKANPDQDIHSTREYLQYKVFFPAGNYCTNTELFNAINDVLNPVILEEAIETDPGLVTADPTTLIYTGEYIDGLTVSGLNSLIAELKLDVSVSLLKVDKVEAIKVALGLVI